MSNWKGYLFVALLVITPLLIIAFAGCDGRYKDIDRVEYMAHPDAEVTEYKAYRATRGNNPTYSVRSNKRNPIPVDSVYYVGKEDKGARRNPGGAKR